MSAGGLRAAGPVPLGNTFDKYGSSNPVVRRLMDGFRAALDDLLDQAAPASILDVGCGEGVLTLEWAERLTGARVVGLDLADPGLEAQWRRRGRENLRFVAADAVRLPFAAGEFELVAAIETLEHLAEPERALSEMARVARGHLLVSVPREPVWRGLNLLRGAYLGRLGNTPGHLNHWSPRGLRRLLGAHGELVALRSPLPWTMALVRVR
jgi:SAM-dependent methyltransferase